MHAGGNRARPFRQAHRERRRRERHRVAMLAQLAMLVAAPGVDLAVHADAKAVGGAGGHRIEAQLVQRGARGRVQRRQVAEAELARAIVAPGVKALAARQRQHVAAPQRQLAHRRHAAHQTRPRVQLRAGTAQRAVAVQTPGIHFAGAVQRAEQEFAGRHGAHVDVGHAADRLRPGRGDRIHAAADAGLVGAPDGDPARIVQAQADAVAGRQRQGFAAQFEFHRRAARRRRAAHAGRQWRHITPAAVAAPAQHPARGQQRQRVVAPAAERGDARRLARRAHLRTTSTPRDWPLSLSMPSALACNSLSGTHSGGYL